MKIEGPKFNRSPGKVEKKEREDWEKELAGLPEPLLNQFRNEVLDQEREIVARYNFIKTHEAPEEYRTLAKGLLEELKRKEGYLLVRYGDSGRLCERDIREIAPGEFDFIHSKYVASSKPMHYYDDPSETCAHGVYFCPSSEKKVDELFNYPTEIIDPTKDSEEEVAGFLWTDLNLFDDHGHIRGYLRSLGLEVPAFFELPKE